MLIHTLPAPPPGASVVAEAAAFGVAFALPALEAFATGAAMVVAGAEAGFAVVAGVCANALPITKVVAMSKV
ncbi:MAG: hypothetical protein Q7R66_18415 [Undibacterium sp.]|uniref:hypothetical protein n=1 Tax=Undibacterium sp. TaxID=1914977 RepID=UPI00271EE72A|nr:hypothetical protein [Undibacterium sp.]MDO8654150.1 hypothetical protein [Undibacterium sp.]